MCLHFHKKTGPNTKQQQNKQGIRPETIYLEIWIANLVLLGTIYKEIKGPCIIWCMSFSMPKKKYKKSQNVPARWRFWFLYNIFPRNFQKFNSCLYLLNICRRQQSKKCKEMKVNHHYLLSQIAHAKGSVKKWFKNIKLKIFWIAVIWSNLKVFEPISLNSSN